MGGHSETSELGRHVYRRVCARNDYRPISCAVSDDFGLQNPDKRVGVKFGRVGGRFWRDWRKHVEALYVKRHRSGSHTIALYYLYALRELFMNEIVNLCSLHRRRDALSSIDLPSFVKGPRCNESCLSKMHSPMRH